MGFSLIILGRKSALGLLFNNNITKALTKLLRPKGDESPALFNAWWIDVEFKLKDNIYKMRDWQ